SSSRRAVVRASPTVPHIFLSQDDPVKLGLVVSFNQPGGNATGMSLLTTGVREAVGASRRANILSHESSGSRGGVSLERYASGGATERRADQYPKRQQRKRYRRCFHRISPTRRCAHREHRSILCQPSSSNRGAGRVPQNSYDLRSP